MPKFPQAAASMIASQVYGNFEQPNTHTRLTPERSTLLVRFQKTLLGQSLRGVGVTNHTQQNPVDTLLVRLDKGSEIIECSHIQACLLLNGNQDRGLLILRHARSSLHQDESAMGRFT
jgi:hypothetical protein